jgi:hypothetical protein
LIPVYNPLYRYKTFHASIICLYWYIPCNTGTNWFFLRLCRPKSEIERASERGYLAGHALECSHCSWQLPTASISGLISDLQSTNVHPR